MTAVGRIEKELEDAKKEYNRYVEDIKKFEDTGKEKRLDQLKRRQVNEDYEGEKEELEEERKELKKKRDFWEGEIKKWGDLMAKGTGKFKAKYNRYIKTIDHFL